MTSFTRREFVKVGTAGAAAVALAGRERPTRAAAMPERSLGRTGHRVRLFSLGGQATLEKPGTHDESVAIINRAIDLGVNYIDTAAAYGQGISQTYIGEVMGTRRKDVFLASKTHDRTRDGSLKLLEQSLTLLKTDRLVQGGRRRLLASGRRRPGHRFVKTRPGQLLDRGDQAIQLHFCVVVVNRRPHHRLESPGFHVQAGGRSRGAAHVDLSRAQPVPQAV